MDNLCYFVNDDITSAILSHLPVKILLKLRIVSKSWRDIIDSSFLRKLHVQNQLSCSNNNIVNINDDIVLLQFSPTPSKPLNGIFKTMILDFPSYKDFLSNNKTDDSCVLFSGVVRGLICVYNKHCCPSNPIGLCNPILKEIKILPESPVPIFPSKSTRSVGLGYDSVEQDFKVVQISSRYGGAVVEVYSRKQNKWRRVVDHPPLTGILILRPLQSSSSGGAFAHWHAMYYSPAEVLDSKSSSNLVVSFDMPSESLKTIRIPRFEISVKKVVHVLAKEDSLIALVWPYRNGDGRLIMWEYKLSSGIDNKRKSDKGGWIKTASLEPLNGRVWPLMWWKSGGLVISGEGRDGWIVFYDCCTGEIGICGNRDLSIRIVSINRPTFISP